jgi:imidazole glycerol-phosphate synthase subunit HisH
MIAIVNSGGANITSVMNALERLGCASKLTSDPEDLFNADHVLLPGVGSASEAMLKLKSLELTDCLKNLTVPVLGICLGMQILFSHSSEGSVDCLGIMPGTVDRFPDSAEFRVPHMGWNQMCFLNSNNPLLRGISEDSHFYFIHSYKAPTGLHVVAEATHGVRFPAIVQHDNYFGVQFHPEKSGLSGSQILRNFIAL